MTASSFVFPCYDTTNPALGDDMSTRDVAQTRAFWGKVAGVEYKM